MNLETWVQCVIRGRIRGLTCDLPQPYVHSNICAVLESSDVLGKILLVKFTYKVTARILG